MRQVVVVGVGAVGSHLVQFLRNEDIEILAVDFDRVEKKNTLSQFHGSMSLGKLKVQGLQQTMQFLWGTKIKVVPHKLTRDNVAMLFGKSTLVVDCLDNGESRRIVQEYVRNTGTSCLHVGLAADGAFGRVVWDPEFKIDDETDVGDATCEAGEHLPFIVIVAAYAARSVQHFLKDDRQLGFSIHAGGAVRT